MELFLQAVALPGDSRGAFLSEACQDDPPLRGEVESLLRHHDSDTILDARAGTLAEHGRRRIVPRSWFPTAKPQNWLDPWVVALLLAALALAALPWWAYAGIKRTLRQNLRAELQMLLDADVSNLRHWGPLR
jgi:hypothetical protein